EREVEHAHRDEPVVHERRGEDGAGDEPLTSADFDDEPRKYPRVREHDERDEELARDDEVSLVERLEPQEERRVRLEEPMKDELRIRLGVTNHDRRREVRR